MVINVKDYVDLWMNDYIVYHAHYFKEYGDLDYGALYFDQKFQEQRGQMGDIAMKSQIDNIKSKAQGAASGLKVFEDLQSGNLIETTMNQIAAGINEGISLYKTQIGLGNYEDILNEAQTFKSSLSHGTMSVKRVNKFFDLILKGVQQAGKIDASLLDGLTNIGKYLSGDDNFVFKSKRRATKMVTQDDIEMAQRIVDMLNNAVNTLGTNGKIDSSSFGSTITNIFSTVIGERVSKTLLAKGIQAALGQTDTILYDLAKQGKLTYNKGSRFTMGGSKHDENNRTSKVDVFNSGAFTLTVTEQGQQYDIEMGVNTSVKWYKGTNAQEEIRIVTGTPLGSYFKSGTPERYLAYNIIAHRFAKEEGSDFHEAYRTLRAATAASFFNEWLTGTGGRIKTKGGNLSKAFTNKVQYLMVNGKVYSVMRIIRNICDDLAKRESWNESEIMPFSMSVQNKIQNKWVGQYRNRPNVSEAMIRSKAVNEVMNKLEISATLNGNILTQYAY